MNEEAEEALNREMYRSLGHFAKEHIWSEDEYDLIRRELLMLSEDELLSSSDVAVSLLNRHRQDIEITAPWEPNIPPDSTIIRRYRTFDRFMTILENSALWFSRTDIFEDHFEGTFPQPNVDRVEEINEEEREGLGEDHRKVQEWEQGERRKLVETANKRTYINCWRKGESESAVFWNAYIGDDLGVAIETTVGDFRNAISTNISDGYLELMKSKQQEKLKRWEGRRNNFRELEDELIEEMSKMQIGLVEYLDYNGDLMSDSKYSRFFHKRNAFEEEQEFRAVFERSLDELDSRTDSDLGKAISIELNTLINSIYLNPNSPDWFSQVIHDILERYDIDADIKRSRLDEEHTDLGKSGFPGTWSVI